MRIPAILFLLIVIISSNDVAAFQLPSTDSLVNELARAKEDTNKVILYRMLTGMVMSVDQPRAISYGKAGIRLGKRLTFDKGVAGCYLNLSVAYSAATKLDSALIYIDSAIVWSKRVGEPSRIALAYLNKADFHMQKRNLRQSLIECDSALRYAERANNNDRRARILQTIGSVYYLQEIYPESLTYYERARELYHEGGNKRMSAVILNNIGNINKRTGHHGSAIDNFNHAITLALEVNDLANLSMYYGNLSDVFTTLEQYALADQNARKAMDYAVQQNNIVQQGVIHNYLAQINVKSKKYTQAAEHGMKAYMIGEERGMDEMQATAAELVAEAYNGTGDLDKAYRFMLSAKDLRETLAKKKYDQDIAAMQASFKLDEKNNEIALLNKDRELQRQQLSRQRILVIGSSLLVLLALGALFLFVSRNRLKERMKEMEIRNTIAADLHDEVGSSLSSIYMLSEMAVNAGTGQGTQHQLLEKVARFSRETMDRMQDLVWMIKPASEDGTDLMERMQRFLYEMCESKNIECRFEGDDLSSMKLSMQQKKTLYLVFKEAVNNSLKYSAGSNMSVKIDARDHQLHLIVSDDGVGFDPKIVKKGNGLDNMRNRANELGGSTEIKSSAGSGTIIHCAIPV